MQINHKLFYIMRSQKVSVDWFTDLRQILYGGLSCTVQTQLT